MPLNQMLSITNHNTINSIKSYLKNEKEEDEILQLLKNAVISGT